MMSQVGNCNHSPLPSGRAGVGIPFRKVALGFLLVVAAATAFAATPCGTNLEYELEGTTLRLISPDSTQPATVWTAAFKNNTTITSVTLPDNVTQVGSQAFYGCTALNSVELANVEDVSTKAFEGCTSLEEIIIPPTMTGIGLEAFRGCTSLSRVYCRPAVAPLLGTDGFTDCTDDLMICVSSLGAYRYETNWNDYYENTKLGACFLDENDEQTAVASKITLFRDTYAKTEMDIFRTLRKAECFNTLTLPFNVPDIEASPLAGAEVCQFVGAAVIDDALRLDIAPIAGNALVAGTPYLIRWPDNGEVLTRLHFTGITWDNDLVADNAGTGEVQLHGFYGKTHINDDTDTDRHLNLFLGAYDRLYWPSDGDDSNAKMLGFRAWFRINGTSVSGAPVRQGMPAALRIVSAPTGLDSLNCNLMPTADKVMINGQLVIIRNGNAFLLNGQRL